MKRNTPVLFFSLIVAGGLLSLAFAPINLWSLAVLSPAYLLWVWQKPSLTPSPRHAFYWGYLFGLGLFGLGISWVFVSIHRYGNTEVPLAVLITGLFVSVLALLIGIQGYILKRFFQGNVVSLCLLGFPALWVLNEWFRSVLLSGFPWLFLGYTQLSTSLSSFAVLGSVYLVSFVLVLLAGALVLFLQGAFRQKMAAAALMASLLGGSLLLQYPAWTTPVGEPVSVSLVQANLDPLDKFTLVDPIQAARNSYEKLSEKHWGSQLLIWPENAIAYPMPYAEPYLKELNHLALAHHTTLIVGLPTLLNKQGDYYNSMVALGAGSGTYHKQHLVPFGEFLPFTWLRGLINFFDIPMSSFVPGDKGQSLLQAGNLKIAPLICYEIAFPELVRSSIKNADTVVTLSEDGWFGNSWGPLQLLDMTRMRAIETGRWIVRSNTCGNSAVIDPKGQVLAVSPQFQAFVLNASVQPMQGETPWLIIGLWPFLIFWMLSFVLPGRLRSRWVSVSLAQT